MEVRPLFVQYFRPRPIREGRGGISVLERWVSSYGFEDGVGVRCDGGVDGIGGVGVGDECTRKGDRGGQSDRGDEESREQHVGLI